MDIFWTKFTCHHEQSNSIMVLPIWVIPFRRDDDDVIYLTLRKPAIRLGGNIDEFNNNDRNRATKKSKPSRIQVRSSPSSFKILRYYVYTRYENDAEKFCRTKTCPCDILMHGYHSIENYQKCTNGCYIYIYQHHRLLQTTMKTNS